MKSSFGFVAIIFGLFFCLSAEASAGVELGLQVDKPLVYCERNERIVLQINLEADAIPAEIPRYPINLSVILDKSGSMRGRKLEDAKSAAIEAIHHLDQGDIFSLIVFDSHPRVLIPATPLANLTSTSKIIRSLEAGGSTALYDGLKLGDSELRRYGASKLMPRIILLSDGLANVGPSRPSDLNALGRQLVREGITISTVGLGLDYNEDLMTSLASISDGNAYFAANSKQLPEIFAEELGDATTLAARNLRLQVTFPEGITPRQVLGRNGTIRGQDVEIELKNLYSSGSKSILIEAEIPGGKPGQISPLAKVTLKYQDLLSNQHSERGELITFIHTQNEEEVAQNLNQEVLKAVTLTKISLEKDRAISLADAGEYAAAATVMNDNYLLLKKNYALCGNDSELRLEAENCLAIGKNIARNQGLSNYERKRLRNEIYIDINQQRYEAR